MFLRNCAGANAWIRFLWLSFWLILGLNSLGSPVKATAVDSESDVPHQAIAFQDPTAATQKTQLKPHEYFPQQNPEKLIANFAESDESIESSVSIQPVQSIALPVAALDKPQLLEKVSTTPELGLAETLGLRGNRLSPLPTAVEEPILVGLEAPAIAMTKTFFASPDDMAITEATLLSTEPIETVTTQSLSQLTNSVGRQEDAIVSQSAAPLEPIENYRPLLEFQAVSIYQDDDFSGRLRATGIYALNEHVLFGAVVDLATGNAFVDTEEDGLSLNELYVSAAPIRDMPNFRLVGGLIDLTAYFDRNSFAKDAATHFFNPVFQTNPALSAAGITSRPGLLVNWSATDNLELKAAAFSSTRDLGDFAIDGFAAEVGFRVENFILRGTYTTARDAGEDDGFAEIFQFQREDGGFGLSDDDREVAYGLNAEYFFESINLGLFGRYGWYENQDLDQDGTTFSFGVTALDIFLEGDRLGLAYGQRLSNSDLRSGKTPDALELLYDAPIFDGVRAGISLQSQDEFSDTFLGLRLRADW